MPSIEEALKSSNLMDKWILAAMSGLIEFIHKEMAAYRLYTVVPRLVKFIEELTNWYVKLNRRRLKGSGGIEDSSKALSCLFFAILNLAKLMSPFTPFFTEYIYQNLKHLLPEKEREESIHFQTIPDPIKEALDPDMIRAVGRMQTVIELARTARERRVLPNKLPLADLTIINSDQAYQQDLQKLEVYVKEEVNVRKVIYESEISGISETARPDLIKLGKRLGKDQGKVSQAIKGWGALEIQELKKAGKIDVHGHSISEQDVLISQVFNGDKTDTEPAFHSNAFVLLNVKVTEQMIQEKKAKEIVNRVQKMRKDAGIFQTDPIQIFYKTESSELQNVVSAFHNLIETALGKSFLPISKQFAEFKSEIFAKSQEVDGQEIFISICRQQFAFNDEALAKLVDNDAPLQKALKVAVLMQDFGSLSNQLKDGPCEFKINNKSYSLQLGVHLH